jgi:Fe-S cluster biogenesis protein NfuA
MDKIEKKIIAVIDKLRPFLISDGGNVEFIKFEDGKVYVKMLGACADCYLVDYTLKDSIETALINEVPEVSEVININD